METKYKIHAFYILVILISIIILLVTIKWGEIPTLVQYITFALTVTSLVLALLAIIYSFYSSTSISQNISTLSGLSQQIAKSSDTLSASAKSLGDQISTLPTHLKLVEGKVDETQSLIKEYYAKQTVIPVTKSEPDMDIATKKIAANYLIYSSHAGLQAIYACCLSFTKNKPFKLENLCETTKFTDYDYAFGYIVATIASGLIGAKTSEEQITVTFVNSTLSAEIKDSLYKRANSKKEESDKESFLAILAALEKYFV